MELKAVTTITTTSPTRHGGTTKTKKGPSYLEDQIKFKIGMRYWFNIYQVFDR